MIRIIKLMTGEEIIGDVSAQPTGVVEIKSPMILAPAQDEMSGKVKLNFLPYAAYGIPDKTIGIYPHAIAADYEPTPDLANHYNTTFGSGIQIVPSMQGLKL
jgi:hypothetical protein